MVGFIIGGRWRLLVFKLGMRVVLRVDWIKLKVSSLEREVWWCEWGSEGGR